MTFSNTVFFALASLFITIGSTAWTMAQHRDIDRGVSRQLAVQRKAALSDVEYDLDFDLKKSGPIAASIEIRFHLNSTEHPLVLDFRAAEDHLKSVQLDGQAVDHRLVNGHILIPAGMLKTGRQSVQIQFRAGDPSLNRTEQFLYTLLVPDRASTVFPCFDQPDLKSRFRLTLTLPAGWIASGNGAVKKSTALDDGRTKVDFRQTKPISTYLFAFAAGQFQTITREIEGRTITMLHRESDAKKVQRNVDDIFTLHALSLDWMQEYTNIEYPFAKFDFVLIPSFPYGGMEHTGNIFYKAESLFLEKSATSSQKLARASLIAHETAHMWFGNLVTMQWFDDVWLKEVFANFMAAKIMNPSFKNINHDLVFMFRHHPQAYGEDRTRGTYPIQQPLENLSDAGTLYGRIIYQKAPIVMRQLETMIGRNALRDGLREYLGQFRFGNAVWDDLISILDRKTETDLRQWSDTWVKQPGTPEIESRPDGQNLAVRQLRKAANQQFWSQQVDIKVFRDGKSIQELRTTVDGEATEVKLPALDNYDFFLTNGSELGYGYFRLDDKSRKYLLENVHNIEDDVTRGAAGLALYETMLRDAGITPTQMMQTLLNGMQSETETLNRQSILEQIRQVYWRFMSTDQRKSFTAEIESALWTWIENPECDNDARSAYFKTLVQIAESQSTIDRLLEIWESRTQVQSLVLGESDYIDLAAQLALRLPEKSATILDTQARRIKDADRKRRFDFIRPSLSADPVERQAFFESLAKLENRRPEPWALDGLTYLHHPLRASESEKFILPGLKMLEEIQSTGDIFFPKRWLVATFSGHRSESAARIVEQFLADRPDYPYRLRNKILQAADLLLRVSKR